jgi:hypothetical protein
MSFAKLALGSALGAALLTPLPAAAQSRIVCDGEFQIVRGTPIATPGCGDRYLAQVAQGYGMRVRHVDLHNPGVKTRVCEFIGHDNRVRTICLGWRNEPSGGADFGN